MREMSQEMSKSTPPAPTPDAPQRGTAAPARSPQFRITALVVIALVLGIVLWLALRHSGSTSTGQLPARSVTQGQLARLATSLGHPIFWAGPQSGFTYEL